MITSKIELVKLVATEGMIFTNGEAFGKEVYLGKNDKPENWHEITEEEYEERQTIINESLESGCVTNGFN